MRSEIPHSHAADSTRARLTGRGVCTFDTDPLVEAACYNSCASEAGFRIGGASGARMTTVRASDSASAVGVDVPGERWIRRPILRISSTTRRPPRHASLPREAHHGCTDLVLSVRIPSTAPACRLVRTPRRGFATSATRVAPAAGGVSTLTAVNKPLHVFTLGNTAQRPAPAVWGEL